MSIPPEDPRSAGLKALRPEIPGIENHIETSEVETFQNQTLRPLLKFQNPLLIQVFRSYIRERKNEFEKLPKIKQPEYISDSLRKDFKLRSLYLGMIVGHFTSEEYEAYLDHEKELKRRIISMLVERLIDQVV